MPALLGFARRQSLRGVDVAKRAEVEVAGVGDLRRPGHGTRVVLEERSEGPWIEEVVLVVRSQQTTGGGQRHAVAHAREHVLERSPRPLVVEDLPPGHAVHARIRRQGAKGALGGRLPGRAMPSDERA